MNNNFFTYLFENTHREIIPLEFICRNQFLENGEFYEHSLALVFNGVNQEFIVLPNKFSF